MCVCASVITVKPKEVFMVAKKEEEEVLKCLSEQK